MTRPYSLDLRRRVVEAVDAGSSCYAVAARFAVSVSFVIKLMQRFRRTGSIEPDRYGGWKRSTVLVHAGRVRALLEAEPDLTLGELQARLATDGVAVSLAALHRFLAADGLTRKKSRSMPPSRTVRTSPPHGSPGATGNRR
jgi:transposase